MPKVPKRELSKGEKLNAERLAKKYGKAKTSNSAALFKKQAIKNYYVEKHNQTQLAQWSKTWV